MIARLRSVPDSVEDFTGFYMGLDLLGGDLLGFGSANEYEPNGTATSETCACPLVITTSPFRQQSIC
jgi:hypothetical protein